MAKKINKVHKKKLDKKCYFCDESDYAVLDVHRIIPGENGGEYTETNSVVACALCHRKIHAGSIKIDRKYFTSAGRWVIHYWKDEQEFWE